ncbi:MAG TPA: hypothetical protein VIP98_21670 [Microlunatus sp.]
MIQRTAGCRSAANLELPFAAPEPGGRRRGASRSISSPKINNGGDPAGSSTNLRD